MPKQVVRVVAGVVERDGRYLITQRRETAVLPLQWEFPGGKVEQGEKDEEALQRELRERLDELTQILGVQIPIHLLFNKVDLLVQRFVFKIMFYQHLHLHHLMNGRLRKHNCE